MTEIEQQRAMLNQHRVQVRGKKDQAGVPRLEKHTRASGITALPHDRLEWLSTSIVHDLRNPLGAIYAAAEMLMDLDSGLTQMQRLATNIFRAAGHMRELLADLNSIAMGNKPAPEMCDIREVIAAACDAAAWGATESSGVQMVLDMPEGIELRLIRRRMQSVFFNLITNAIEAMPTGGRLHITARETAGWVLIEMEDTGPGIPRGIRDRLFEAFVTAGKHDGLGLGLALARQTVLSHGGDIWVESSTGARFVMRLPVQSGLGLPEILAIK